MELAKSEVLRSIRYGTALSLIMLDLDHFKSINDQFGHHAGDVALTALAAFLDNTKRANDIIGRLGGEEFAILLPETPLDDARMFAERIRAGIAEISLNDSGNSFRMTASLGIVQLQSESLDELLSRADGLMYQAKAQGRDRIISG
jgi:diguanylate cyclase (GGDEF)-like protein